MGKNKIFILVFCIVLCLASAIVMLTDEKDERTPEMGSLLEELDANEETEAWEERRESQAQTEDMESLGNPVAEEDLGEEKTTASLTIENAEEIDALLPLQGHTHLVSDLEAFLKENEITDAKTVYIVKDSEKYEGGVLSFEARIDTSTKKLLVTYTEKDDIFEFWLE